MPEEPGPDPELEAALDSFLDWADHADSEGTVTGLPPLAAIGVEPGAVFGDFELVRRLGAGGMGVVFEARQLSVNRRVAVKLLRSPLSSERLSARFRREVAIVGELDHPGIVPVVAAGMEQGLPWYAMKFVEGVSVARLLNDLRASATAPDDSQVARTAVARLAPVPERGSSSGERESDWEASYPRWAARFVLQAAEALQHAHDRHVVHRDVKPGNLMITPLGRPVVLDFGLARGAEDVTLTSEGDFLGTLAYAAPEQARAGEAVDGRADVYGLGATLYELLTLRRPHEAPSKSELLRRIQEEEPGAMDSALPPELRAICLRCLAKSPDRRYLTAAALARDLRAFLRGEPVEARLPGPAARAVRLLRRHPRATIAAAVLAAAFLGMHVRDRARAGGRVVLAVERMDTMRSLRRSLEQLRQEFAESAFDSPGERESLRERIRELRVSIDEGHDEVEDLLVQAFQHSAGHPAARRALADHHADRLEVALERLLDLYDPERLASIEQALARHDEQGRYAALLSESGRARLTVEPSDATVRIHRDPMTGEAGELRFEGTGPLVELDLPEGSYCATASADGFREVRYPFVVRREAAYARGATVPPREHSVHLLPEGWVPPQYVHVPAGWTLVEDEPPVWEHVPTFLIRRFEVTYEEVVGWLNASQRLAPLDPFLVSSGEPSPQFKPRFSESILHVARQEDGTYRLGGYHDPRMPVRSLTQMEMGQYAQYLELLEPGGPEGWHDALPRRFEWIRAARGGDARPWSFGCDFFWDRCGGYFSAAVPRHAMPFPVGAFPGDVSPFGVRDMTGSIAEMTSDPAGAYTDRWTFCGGGFDTSTPLGMHVLTRGSARNRPREDVGFRTVKRPMPAWVLTPDRPPEPFHDDFERPDAEDAGNGWVETAGAPFSHGWTSGPEEWRLAGGRLVCDTRRGDFSKSGMAWHRIHVPPGGWVVSATLEGRCEETDPDRLTSRNFGLYVVTGFQLLAPSAFLQVRFDGRASLVLNVQGVSQEVEAQLPTRDGPLHFELCATGSRIEGRIWPAGRPRPRAPLFESATPPGFPPRFLGVSTPNYVGARVEIHEVEVRFD